MPAPQTAPRITTRQQRFSQAAFQCVSEVPEKEQADFKRFAQQFPALVHQCGLAQAIAFADAKKHRRFLKAIAAVIGATDTALSHDSRNAELTEYLRLTRNVMLAAEWLKRSSEALIP